MKEAGKKRLEQKQTGQKQTGQKQTGRKQPRGKSPAAAHNLGAPSTERSPALLTGAIETLMIGAKKVAARLERVHALERSGAMLTVWREVESGQVIVRVSTATGMDQIHLGSVVGSVGSSVGAMEPRV